MKKAGIASSAVLSAVMALTGGEAFATGSHGGHDEGGNVSSGASAAAGATAYSAGSSINNNVSGGTTTVGGQTTNVGGQSTNVGGQQASQTAGMTNSTTINNKPMIPGYAPAIISPSGECGKGWVVSLSGPWSGAGFGKADQSDTCLEQRFNSTFINAGVVMLGNGFETEGANAISTGMRAQANISPNFAESAKGIASNELLSCVQSAPKRLSITLMAQDLECTDEGKIAIKKPAMPHSK